MISCAKCDSNKVCEMFVLMVCGTNILEFLAHKVNKNSAEKCRLRNFALYQDPNKESKDDFDTLSNG